MRLHDALDATLSAPIFSEAAKQGTALAPDDVKAIGKWTRGDIEQERLFSFPLLAIDSAPTRNNVQYTAESQKASVKAWVGVPFLFNSSGNSDLGSGADHRLAAANQVGRVFKSQLVRTAQGETATLLWAYAVRGVSQQTDDFIAKVEAGILREVSIHVMVESVNCSICNVKTQDCEKAHVPGEKYGREVCVMQTQGALEPLEVSAVACPGSTNAHVMADDDATKLTALREALARPTADELNSRPRNETSTERPLTVFESARDERLRLSSPRRPRFNGRF